MIGDVYNIYFSKYFKHIKIQDFMFGHNKLNHNTDEMLAYFFMNC